VIVQFDQPSSIPYEKCKQQLSRLQLTHIRVFVGCVNAQLVVSESIHFALAKVIGEAASDS
jgi:hypothetical protein